MCLKIVITGVTRGLGRALTDEFIQQGHLVIGCGRSEDILRSMSEDYPKNTYFNALDISDFNMVSLWAKEIIKKYRAPDFLINNAGIINKNAPLWEVPVKEFSDVIDINVKGTFNVIKAFLPEMFKVGSGTIVNFSSGWGRSTSSEVAPYCSSKWAIEGLTKSLAQELTGNLTCISLNPGIINTDMLRSCLANAKAYEKPKTWAKRATKFILNIKKHENGSSLTVD